MPSKPTWFHRLPEILDALCGMDATHLDRQAVEGRVFGLSASQLLVRHSFDHTKRSTWNARAET